MRMDIEPPARPFLLSEAPGQHSRENLTVTMNGQALQSGQLLAAEGAKFVPFSGSGCPAAIAITEVPAQTGEVRIVAIVRDAEIYRPEVTGLTPEAEVVLLSLGIVTRRHRTLDGRAWEI